MLNFVSSRTYFKAKADWTRPLLPIMLTFLISFLKRVLRAFGLIYVFESYYGFRVNIRAMSMATFPFPMMVTSLILDRFSS